MNVGSTLSPKRTESCIFAQRGICLSATGYRDLIVWSRTRDEFVISERRVPAV